MTVTWGKEEHLTITIEDDGSMKFIDSPAAREFAEALGGSVVYRASHVLPDNAALRLLFRTVRAVSPDDSHIAEWTRGWRCLWRVDASPIGGSVLPGRWIDREKAIAAEVEYVNNLFLNR